MPAQFDAKSYISKQAFSPLSEVWDHRSKKVTSSSAKQGGVDQAVADIAATSREVCAAAIQSLNLNTGSKLDLELLDGAIATLNAVISNRPSSTEGLRAVSGQNVQADELELKDDHKASLNMQLHKLRALRALHGKKNGQETLGKFPDLYRAIAKDLQRVDPNNPELQRYASQLGLTGADSAASTQNPVSVVNESDGHGNEQQILGQAFSLIENARKGAKNPRDAESIREIERQFRPFLDF